MNSVLGDTSAQAHHEALAAHLGDDARMAVLQLGEALLEEQALALDLLQEAGLQDHVEHRVAHRHGERVAAEGGAVGADRHAPGGLGRGEAGAHREAAADALGHRHDVGRHAGPFIGEELAGAADAGLDLVEDQEQAVLVAEAAQFAQEGVRDRAGRRPRPGSARS